ncbi:MAG: DNA repair protein RecO [Bacteroidales bacterium]|nr:DNA repair protein RecO [Bacteroidales bacterium]
MAKTTSKTRAIVLQSIKYGDSSLVVKMLTEELGIQSYMVKGVFGKKSKMKAALFQNMTLLEIVADTSSNSLGFIREISLSHYYQSIATDIKKSTIIIFVSELLSKAISESESDPELFNFIYDSMLWLDEATSDYANFPIVFALKLSRYLGFFPNIDTYSEKSCFDLLDGNFKMTQNDIHQIDEELSRYFYDICKASMRGDQQNLTISNSIRRKLLESIVMYYKLHADEVRDIKSYEILRTLLDA